MKWQGRRTSTNVEDRRGMSGKGIIGGGIGTIIIVILYMLMGGNPTDIINQSQQGNPAATTTYQETAEEKELAEFTSVVLAETETVWTDLFAEQGLTYTYPTLVLFSGSVDSACGIAGSATGPFYCPGDQNVYIDLSFYQDMATELQASGDFAMAYVIAHEVGHHVQKLLGTMDKVNDLRSKLSETEYNEYSVRLELQADYYAGVWAHYVNRTELLEAGDLEEALNAASAVGDDRIQNKSQGYAVPDSFTHGTSEQRQRWFYKGYESGSLAGGDTFSVQNL